MNGAKYDGALRVYSRGVLSFSVSFKVLSGTSYETDFGSAPLKFCRRAGIALLTHAAKGDDEWVYFMIPAMR